MGEGFPGRTLGRATGARDAPSQTGRSASEPVACAERGGPTPTHPEPGRETPQRRRYWRDARWESRSVRPSARRGAVAARRAHNPKVGGSNPPAATISIPGYEILRFRILVFFVGASHLARFLLQTEHGRIHSPERCFHLAYAKIDPGNTVLIQEARCPKAHHNDESAVPHRGMAAADLQRRLTTKPT